MKRKVERPWAHRQNGGWVFQNTELADALKKGDIADFGGITVGARQLRRLVSLLPHEDCLVRANGRLEVEAIQRTVRRRADGTRRCSFRKPRRFRHWFAIENGAWTSPKLTVTVVIRPKRY